MRQLEFWGNEPDNQAPATNALDVATDDVVAQVERLVKPLSLIRPDRQQLFDAPHHEWPKPMGGRDSITVDRIRDDIDGPAHRFSIQRHDFVEVFLESGKVDYGYVVGISHSRQQVRVAFSEPFASAKGSWFDVGSIYPAVERFNEVHESPVTATRKQARLAKARLLNNPEAYASVKRLQLIRLRALHDRPQLTSTRESVAFFKQYWKDNPAHDQEMFTVANCDTKHRVMSVVVVTVGTLDASLVHPREVFKSAILEGASAIILSHNHPSGDPTPSREDHQVTEQLTEAGKLIGINVLDHVIYGDGTGEAISIRESS